VSGLARTARWASLTLAGLGMRDLAGILVVALTVVAALCWVLRYEDRFRRLAEIIHARRGGRVRVLPRRPPRSPRCGTARQRPHRRSSRAVSPGNRDQLHPVPRPSRFAL
jgi:hypothetical protein